ncbi:protein STPG3-like [Xenia sp. Carnegie-2017]|uniref:protein STPG3-like n=1 Tax=Xenia sp. Carnegie-2017 TaxID=2897299 RepID=UPI001F0355BC|nr:protein STPG3-like [Xenia sp. Carnegie-2017]
MTYSRQHNIDTIQREKKKNMNTKGHEFATLELGNPSPAAYNPPVNPPNMTTPPAYTMRPKTYPEKGGGDRVSWGKEWFATDDRWTIRANFCKDSKWPSPSDYATTSTIGQSLMTCPTFPSYSIGKRKEFSLVSKDAKNFPSPLRYNRVQSQNAVLTKSPSFTIERGRRKGTLPFLTKTDHSPGPGRYNPNAYKSSSKIRRPAFTIPKSPRLLEINRNCSY